MAPELETARLRLRGLRVSDAPDFAAIHGDAEVVRYLGGTPFGREDSFRRLLMCAGLWTIFGFGYWAVVRRDDDRAIGLLGFADFKRDLTPSIEGLPEMGWIFASDVHGQGYAGEGVAAALDWADRELGREIPAIIDPRNTPSIRVAERAGFGAPQLTSYKDGPILLFRRPAP